VLYCSRDCQRTHWKANHKQHCIAKAERTPQQQSDAAVANHDASSAPSTEGRCAICQDQLNAASATTLPCNHVFHKICVAELRKYGIVQVCPLCRGPLPPGPEKIHEEAARRYMVVLRQAVQGKASWAALPASAQHELDAAIAGWRAAAGDGYASAQLALGEMFAIGRGVAQSYEEAARLFKKASDQGHAQAQNNLGRLSRDGQGVAQSNAEAAKWYLKAATQGLASAQHSLGLMYSNG